ncbi:hypothetical protein F383_15569 [Gossypium arboreum]|uniref:Uncharacterized protein n=1 Tax=Gossypium arboreum TaxID=29729 RepID=A0A0B0NBP9_GOSAR|nr:hypothetical protein F383_15569 [Gossypium arboreum]
MELSSHSFISPNLSQASMPQKKNKKYEYSQSYGMPTISNSLKDHKAKISVIKDTYYLPFSTLFLCKFTL